MVTEGTVGLLPSGPCRGLPRGREGTLSQPLWPGHSQRERGLSRLRRTEGLMGPSRRSRSSEPREAFQPPAGPSAPAWRPVGWVAGLDAVAGGCRVRTWVPWAGLEGRGCSLSCAAVHPHCWGPAAFSTLLPARPLKSACWGLRRLSASWPLAHRCVSNEASGQGPGTLCRWFVWMRWGSRASRASGPWYRVGPPPVPPLAGGLGRGLEKQPGTQQVLEGQLGRAQISAWGQSCQLVSPQVG